MDIHERLKYLRKQLKLTTRAFGASINMSGGAITNMEKGLRNITNRTAKDICREYNININWFLNGIEPMYSDILNDLEINSEVKELAKQYALLDTKDRALIKNMINALYEKIELQGLNLGDNGEEDDDEDQNLSSGDLRKIIDRAMSVDKLPNETPHILRLK